MLKKDKMVFNKGKKLREAFEKEALPYLDALYGTALRLTQDEQNAEDLVQDAMVKAFRFYEQFEKGSNIKAWLFRVLITTFYNTCRKNRNIQRLHNEAELEPNHDAFLSEASTSWQMTESTVLDRLVTEKLHALLEEIPEDFRMAVILCDLNGFGYKDIAEILNCPVGTVMSRVFRGRRMLQKKLYHYAVEQGYIRPRHEKPVLEKPADLQEYRKQRGRS